MSHLIDVLSYSQLVSNQKQSNRNNINFQSLINYLRTFTNISQALKIFSCKGQKCEIVLQINLFKHFPSIIQKIQIDRKRLTYHSKFILKIESEVLCCQTKCLRLMLIKQLQSLKKKIRLNSYSIIIDQNTGQIIGKNIMSITPTTNVYQLLMFELISIRTYLIKYLSIILSLVNILPPLLSECMQDRVKGMGDGCAEERIQKRIYKYYYFSIIQLWKSLSKSPCQALEEPQDKQLQQKLQKQKPWGFNEQSSQMFIHRPKTKYLNQYKFQITPQESSNIQIHLKIPMMQAKKSESNFVFSEVKVLQESNEAIDTGLRGASTKIMISKLKFIYLNSLVNHSQGSSNNARGTPVKQYTKLVAIKVPLEGRNLERQQRKSLHQIGILKLFNEAESPFLLRYFVSGNENFRYNNRLMMSFINNCETIAGFLSKRKQVLSFSSKLYVLINVLQALRLIKQYNVVHMDISPSNILVNQNLLTQLIDFGQSYHQKICKKDYNPGYTLPFTFPQKFTKKTFNNKSDMFSFGVLTFFTMFRSLPYCPTQKLVEDLKNFTYINKFFFAPQSVQYYGYRKLMIFLFSFIQRCMDPDPLIRPHPGWAIILFKQLYFWLEEVAMNS